MAPAHLTRTMDGTLKGKNAIVTGGTRGIGRAITEALVAEGVRVAICGRSQPEVDKAAAELSTTASRVVGRSLDVRDADAVTAYFKWSDEALGPLDILVNNAGIGIFRSVEELSFQEWKDTLDTNLTGVFLCSKEAIGRMRTRGGGTIVNISSLAGKNPFAGGSAYNASKFALNGFSEAMMLDHRRDGIRVSYVMPGSVDTDFSPRSARAAWKIAPEDVAAAVLLVLRTPARTTISRVEIRPSVPPQ